MTAQTGKGQHTPGPWQVAMPIGRPPSRRAWEIGTTIGPSRVLARGIRSYADARLMKTAPELLSILRLLMHYLDRGLYESAMDEQVLDQARAAIRLAEGEG